MHLMRGDCAFEESGSMSGCVVDVLADGWKRCVITFQFAAERASCDVVFVSFS